MSTLLLELPAEPPWPDTPSALAQAEYRYAFTRDGQLLDGSGEAVAAMLPPADQIILVLPPQTLSWHRLELPKLPASRFLSGIQALLEDRLLLDATETHLALQPGFKPGQAGSCWVAAVRRPWLAAHVQHVEQTLGRAVARIAPGLAPDDGNPALVRQQAPSGQVWWHSSQPDGVLSLPWAALSAVQPEWPRQVWAEPAQTQALQTALETWPSAKAEAMRPEVSIQPAARMLMLALKHEWDLAQFDLARSASQLRRRRLSQAWQTFAWDPAWAWPRRALIGLLLVQLVGLTGWAWMERRAQADLRSQSQALLTRTFPQVRTVIDAPLQMAREVQKLEQARGQGQATDLEPLLQWWAQTAPDAPAPSALEYSAGQLVLREVSLPAHALERVQQQAQARGLSLRVQGKDLILGARP